MFGSNNGGKHIDLMKRASWKVVVACFAPLAVGLLLMKRGGLLERTNVAQTAPNHPDPLLRTRHFSQDLQATLSAAQSTLAGLSTYGRAWKTKQIRRDADSIVFTVEVPVLKFTDDLSVMLKRSGDSTICDVRSASRVGAGDFGENRRHIRQFLHALDAKLK
jgi:uncharacterized protein (DUF1499 family)